MKTDCADKESLLWTRTAAWMQMNSLRCSWSRGVFCFYEHDITAVNQRVLMWTIMQRKQLCTATQVAAKSYTLIQKILQHAAEPHKVRFCVRACRGREFHLCSCDSEKWLTQSSKTHTRTHTRTRGSLINRSDGYGHICVCECLQTRLLWEQSLRQETEVGAEQWLVTLRAPGDGKRGHRRMGSKVRITV